MAYAVAGLYLSDTAEEKFNMKATDEDRAKLKEMIPRIHTVERDESPISRTR